MVDREVYVKLRQRLSVGCNATRQNATVVLNRISMTGWKHRHIIQVNWMVLRVLLTQKTG